MRPLQLRDRRTFLDPFPVPLLSAGFVLVPLCGRKKLFAKVSYDDLHLVDEHRWYESHGYATTVTHRYGSKRADASRSLNEAMHRLIMGTPPTPEHVVDHINHDRLDNRRENLRWLLGAVNSGRTRVAKRGHTGNQPKYGYRGIHPAKEQDRWIVWVADKNYGQYPSKELAARVYDRVVQVRYPDGDRELNFPNDPLPHDFPITNLNVAARRASRRSAWSGVSWFAPRKKWRAIYENRTLGYYSDEDAARDAVQAAWTQSGRDYPGRRKVV